MPSTVLRLSGQAFLYDGEMPSSAAPTDVELEVATRPSRSVTWRGDALTILICANTRDAANDIDGTLRELLTDYGYDFSAPETRSEFKGSWFVRYRFHRQSGELEEDLQVEFSDQPPRKEIPAKKRGLMARLRRKLEKLKVILVVGSTLFASIAYGRELYENFLKAFHTKPGIVMEVQRGRQVGNVIIVETPGPPGKVMIVEVPPAMIPVIENAEHDPEKFKLLLDFLVANQCATPQLPPTTKPSPPPKATWPSTDIMNPVPHRAPHGPQAHWQQRRCT
jgi:hypothetical protein